MERVGERQPAGAARRKSGSKGSQPVNLKSQWLRGGAREASARMRLEVVEHRVLPQPRAQLSILSHKGV